MQLQERFGDQVAAVALNLDFDGGTEGPTEELQSEIASLLKKLEITCENVISSDPMDAVLEEFEIFSLPAVLIYDQQGLLHQRFDGSVSYSDEVTPEVEKLLGASS